MTQGETELLEAARSWAAADPDPATKQWLEMAVAGRDLPSLAACFGQPLRFGTAGLRGPVGVGPAHLNLALVARLGWAIGDFLSSIGKHGRGVVVGFDARVDSPRFARRLAEVLGAHCPRVWMFEEPIPTPLVAHAARALRCGAAVVVTASHNPAGDNGIKLYDDEGIQIVSPWDSEVETRLRSAPPADTLARNPQAIGPVPADTVDAYFLQLEAQLNWKASTAVRVAYTPVSGVGLAALERALRGSRVVLAVVPEQGRPDGTFPGTPFPNPEEPGVMDAVLDLAQRRAADLAIANDPDADRLAAALPDGQGGWITLSGDDLGLLFAEEALESTAEPEPVGVSSIVSSPGLDVLFALAGGRVVRTLTGFKWIARVLHAEPRAVFGYEEALGYCFRAPAPHLAPLDKDGIAGAAHLCALLAREGSGERLLERLARLFRKIGLWVSVGESLRFEGPSAGADQERALDRLRKQPPVTLGGAQVVGVTDFSRGAELRPVYLGSQELLCLDASDGTRVLVRPSGTEPKLKFYVHARGELPPGRELIPARQALRARAKDVALEVMAAAGSQSSAS